jgi:uncharacterized repeat protein (TIGR02543 family)
MSNVRLNTKNINKKVLTIVVAVALFVAAGAVALGLSVNSKTADQAQATISFTAGNLKPEIDASKTASTQQLVFLTVDSTPTYEVKAAWAYYTMPVSGKLYQVPLNLAGTAWYGSFDVTSSFEDGLWKFSGVSIETTDGKELFENTATDSADGDFTVTGGSTELNNPQYKLESAVLSTTAAQPGNMISLSVSFEGKIPTEKTVLAYLRSPSGKVSKQVELSRVSSSGNESTWYGTVAVDEGWENGDWTFAGVQAGLGDGTTWTYNLKLEDTALKTVNITASGGSALMPTYKADDSDSQATPKLKTVAEVEQEISLKLTPSSMGDVADEVNLYYIKAANDNTQYQVKMEYNDSTGKWVGKIPADELTQKGYWYLAAVQIKTGDKEAYYYSGTHADLEDKHSVVTYNLTSGDFFVGTQFEVEDIETEIDYDGDNHKPIAIVHPKGEPGTTLVKDTDYKLYFKDPDGNVISEDNYDTAFVDAGIYTMVAEGIDGTQYEGNMTEKTWEIKKIPIKVNKAPNGLTNTYNSANQNIVTAPTMEGVDVVDGVNQVFYAAVDEQPEKDATDVWSTDIPQKIDAGTYTVYYWAKGDKNHLDTEIAKTEKDPVINKYTVRVIPQAKEKIYDGTTDAEVYIDDKLGAGEEMLSFANVKGEYTDRNVSTSTKVNITNQDEIVVSVSGGQANPDNYDVTYNLDEAYAQISPRSVTMYVPQSAITTNKTYDGTKKAQIDSFYVDTGFGGDVLIVSGLTAEYQTKNVGEDIPITVPNIADAKVEGIEGTRVANYDIVEIKAESLKGDINERRAMISAKSYEVQYGDPIPALETEELADFLEDEQPVLGVDYELTCSATSLSAPGYYAVNVVTKDTDLMKNYKVINSRGIITIVQGDTYTVRFEGNGADEGTMDDQVIYRDKSTALKANTFTREGYTFLGWSTERKDKTPSLGNEMAVKNLTERAGRITLYAIWKDNTKEDPSDENCYTVKFDANGGNEATMLDQKIEYDKSTKLAKNIFTREGYTFVGWSDDKDAKTKSLDDGAYVTGLVEKGKTIILYAIWSEDEDEATPEDGYTVIFDANGGEGDMSNQVIDVNKSTAISKNLYTKTGYRFLGWSLSKDATTAQLSDQSLVTGLGKAGEKIILYAVWQDEDEEIIDPTKDGYTLQFEPNGGIGMMADQVIGVDKDTKLSKNIFKRAGFTFWGWSTNPDSTVISLTDEQEVTNLAEAGQKITLYAIWWDDNDETPDPKECYTIHYDANGGMGTMADQTVEADVTTNLATNIFTRKGYTFMGWSLYQDTDTPALKNEAEVTHLANKGATVTLYAVWQEGKVTPVDPVDEGYTIKFDSNGGTGTMSDEVVKTNKMASLPKNIYTRTGYNFLGWSLSRDATAASLADNQQVYNLTKTGQTVTLYAVWQSTSVKPIDDSKAYTIIFDPNGGDGTMADQKVEVGVATNLAWNTFTPKDGYEFLGWSPDPDATDASLADGVQVTNLAKAGRKVVLFAVWKKSTEPPAPSQTYTVKYDANGGDGSMESQTMVVGTPTKLSGNVFTREAHSFLGWSTKKGATTPDYKDCSTVTNLTTGGKQVTLYAVWESIYSKATKAPSTKTGLVYNGAKQDLIEAGEAEGGTIMYGVSSTEDSSGVSEWSESVPQATNAGTYNVFYYVKADETHENSVVSELQQVVIDKRKAEVVVADPDSPTSDEQKGRVDVNENSGSKNGTKSSSERKAVATVSNLVGNDKLEQDVDYSVSNVASDNNSSTLNAKFEVTEKSTDAMNNYELTSTDDSVVVNTLASQKQVDKGAKNDNSVIGENTPIVGVSFVSVLMVAGVIAFVIARKRKKEQLDQ